MSRFPIVICLDVEPDDREIDSRDPKDWEGFEGTFEFFRRLRPRLEEATGAPVNYSWFFRMDPQIEHAYGTPWWVVERYRDTIKSLEIAGDEIGLHAHVWRWNEALHEWIADQGDQKWVEHCVRVSFSAYRKAFGRPCLSFRFGERWMNNQTMHLLEALGTKFDLTIEPGMKAAPGHLPRELCTGSLPDYSATPREPYRPSREDFRMNGGRDAHDLWAIPISTGKRQTLKTGPFARLRRAASAFKWRHHPSTLDLSIGAEEFRYIMNRLLGAQKERYLAPVVRTDVCSKAGSRANLEQNINSIISHPQAGRFAFVTPAGAIELLNSDS